MAEKYNGWTNYETWAAGLWISNEEISYRYWHKCAKSTDVDTLARKLKDEFEAAAPELTGLYADLLGAALSEVNWHEIAEDLSHE